MRYPGCTQIQQKVLENCNFAPRFRKVTYTNINIILHLQQNLFSPAPGIFLESYYIWTLYWLVIKRFEL